MRWLTIGAPGQDDFEILLEKPTNSFIDEESRGQIGSPLSKGAMGLGFILYTDDCRRTFDDLVAKGVEAIDEPTERFYGIDCAVRDPFGNHIRITQPATRRISTPRADRIASGAMSDLEVHPGGASGSHPSRTPPSTSTSAPPTPT